TPSYTFYYSNTVAADPHTITAEFDEGDENLSSGSWTYDVVVNAGMATKLLMLMPGETYLQEGANGKTGFPDGMKAEDAIEVTVYAVDDDWNIITTANHEVLIRSTDEDATLPEPEPASLTLSSGTGTFDITFKTSGPQEVTVSTVEDVLAESSGSVT